MKEMMKNVTVDVTNQSKYSGKIKSNKWSDTSLAVDGLSCGSPNTVDAFCLRSIRFIKFVSKYIVNKKI
jgi:hypothetical protein